LCTSRRDRAQRDDGKRRSGRIHNALLYREKSMPAGAKPIRRD
jgi:hypothetical protein